MAHWKQVHVQILLEGIFTNRAGDVITSVLPVGASVIFRVKKGNKMSWALKQSQRGYVTHSHSSAAEQLRQNKSMGLELEL